MAANVSIIPEPSGDGVKLTVVVEPGLMLDFWEDSLALEKVLIELMPLEQGRSFYSGELPAPFSRSMTHADIRELLGTPLLVDPFHADRWDYVFTLRRQGVPDQKRVVSVFFDGDVVKRFDAGEMPSEREFVSSIDRPVKDKEAPKDLTPEQIAALPVPAKTEVSQPQPQGAIRDYPPLEAGRP